jgi:hypothetical protein
VVGSPQNGKLPVRCSVCAALTESFSAVFLQRLGSDFASLEGAKERAQAILDHQGPDVLGRWPNVGLAIFLQVGKKLADRDALRTPACDLPSVLLT